jgi:isopenicillin N synthase-like dioxygenase
MESAVPELSLADYTRGESGTRDAFCTELMRGFQRYGFIILRDSGDMLAHLTNEVIPATTHRVVNPKRANVSRYSMPFFNSGGSRKGLSREPAQRHYLAAHAVYMDIYADRWCRSNTDDENSGPHSSHISPHRR